MNTKNSLTEVEEDEIIKEDVEELEAIASWAFSSDYDWDIESVTQWSEGCSRTRPRLAID